MLHVSKATDYALLFLTNLAKRPGRQWSVREAAEKLRISRRFLANITHQLARQGIIVTSKGAKGGVTLEKNPRTLTIGEVVKVFEGSVDLLDCLCPGYTCERASGCSMRPFWRTLARDIDKALHTTTIQDLGERA